MKKIIMIKVEPEQHLTDMFDLPQEMIKIAINRKLSEKRLVEPIKKYNKVLDAFWTSMERRLEEELVKADYSKIKVFSEYLDCKPTDEELQKKTRGSKSYKLIWKLRQRGAEVMWTECKEALGAFKRDCNLSNFANLDSLGIDLKEMIEERDKRMAFNIEELLNEGDIGLLFIGIPHNIEKYLTEKTTIEVLDTKDLTETINIAFKEIYQKIVGAQAIERASLDVEIDEESKRAIEGKVKELIEIIGMTSLKKANKAYRAKNNADEEKFYETDFWSFFKPMLTYAKDQIKEQTKDVEDGISIVKKENCIPDEKKKK